MIIFLVGGKGKKARRDRKLNAFLASVAAIFTQRLNSVSSLPSPPPRQKKRCRESDGRQEIKYNATKKSRT